MGSKSSKWLAAGLTAAALAVVPAGAVAKLDYSKNSVGGQYLQSPARQVPQINDIASFTRSPAPVGTHWPVAPSQSRSPVSSPSATSDSGFSVADALAGAGAALLIAFAGIAIVRRRHPSPLAS